MIAIAEERVATDLEKLRQIGSVNGQKGVSRIAYTTAENEAHSYMQERMKEEGLETRVDEAGNLYGLLRKGERKISVGSHLDTVHNGGNYDGALGVVIGIEAARMAKEENLGHSIEIVAFRAEESARFGASCIGSKLVTGRLTPKQARQITDKEGTTLYEAAAASGFYLDNLKQWDKEGTALYIEPHIEQADALLEAGVPLGIVTGIRAPARYDITVIGTEAHSGATSMNARKDAIAAFGEMTLAAERIAKGYGSEGVATVATIHASASQSINKVAGYVIFGLDIRGNTPQALDELEAAILKAMKEIAEARSVKIATQQKEKGTPAKLRQEDYRLIGNAAAKLGIQAMEMPSGAGHDAQYISLHGIPTAMLFIRNSNGSHNPYEAVSMQDVETGTNVLAQTILEADRR